VTGCGVTDAYGNALIVDTNIWIYDLLRGLRTRFSFDPAVEQTAIWSPDGRTIVFNSKHKGHFDLYRKASDGTGVEELLYADDLDKRPTSWSPDGNFVLYHSSGDPKTGNDLWVLLLGAGAKPFPLLQTPFNEQDGQYSPDGKWVAYTANESGRAEIYVIPFRPEGGAATGKRQVSTEGGLSPRWQRDGKELFYIASSGKLVAAEVSVKAGTFEAGNVRVLFEGSPTVVYRYEVAANGQRFLAAVPPDPGANADTITVVQNWRAGLKE
jgi:Tol biopolymer transport system component